eukprot:2259885-Prymnesium_polylepis.1
MTLPGRGDCPPSPARPLFSLRAVSWHCEMRQGALRDEKIAQKAMAPPSALAGKTVAVALAAASAAWCRPTFWRRRELG